MLGSPTRNGSARVTAVEFPQRAAPPAEHREFDRTPPQNIEAEQSVLGGMLLSKDAIADVVEVLRPGDFYRPAHQVIYEAAVDLYGRGEPVDQITVAAELTRTGEITRIGGATYLIDLAAAVPTAASAGYYAKIVAEQAILRRLVEAGTRIVQLGYGGRGGEVDDIVDRAQQAIFDVTERRTSEDYIRLEDLLQPTLDEIEAIGSRDGDLHGVPTGFKDLDALTNGLHPGQLVIVAARPAIGKALALDTPLPTPTGWTTMGEVAVGDLLLDRSGRPTPVVAATEVMTGRPCYEVEFADGTVVVADAQHQWLTDTRASRRSGGRAVALVRTTAEIAATLRCETADRRLNHSVPNAAPLDLPDADLPLSPYVLGAWLGDGHSAAARITTGDPEMVLHLEDEGYRVVPSTSHGLTFTIRLPEPPSPAARICVVCGAELVNPLAHVRTCGQSCGGRARFVSAPVPAPTCPDCGRPSSGLLRCQECHDAHGTVQDILRSLGVLGAKRIPAAYLRASEAQRRALLAGLMDTDGTVTPLGQLQFCVTSRRLAEDVRELVTSLGYRVSMCTKAVRGRTPESSTAYTLNFTTCDEVFRLERKRLAHKDRRGAKGDVRNRSRFIVAVRPVESVPVRCVEVGNAEHLYLATRSMIPTHNSTLGLDFSRAASIKAGKTSVIFSLEMSKHEITMRLLSAEARVSLQNMRTGRMTDDDWSRLARRMGEVANAPLFIDDSPNLTMMEIRAKARRLKQRQNLELIVVDYMQLMSSPRKVENRQQEVSEISRSMKLLAKELEVPVVAISQLNRGPESRTDKKPQLSDLRESGSLEQDADMVILLYREDAFEKESPRAGEADFIVAKHRNGPTGTITVAFQGHYSRFIDMTPTG
jgi:replicative DNA helicase